MTSRSLSSPTTRFSSDIASTRFKQGFSREQSLNTRLLRELSPSDIVTHIDRHGIGKFAGLQKIEIGGQMQEAVRLIYKNNDILYVSIHSLHKIAKYVGQEGTPPQLSKIGSDAWKQLKNRTKKKIKDIAAELIKLYAKRRTAPGHAFPIRRVSAERARSQFYL
jgi:transcription-repair coupling factor (superfamily II helicase)